MNNKKCCIVIPTYKKYEMLNNFEKKTLENTINIMDKYPIIFICPKGLIINGYLEKGYKKEFLFLNEEYFKNIYGYNNLMLSTSFYELFKDYDYMLLVQLDAYIFKDNLEYFLNLEYDYIGSLHYINEGTNIYHPNVGNEMINGNGGFSLRKISAFIEASKNIKKDLNNKFDWEDVLYSYWYKDKMNIAPNDVSLIFGWQQDPQLCYEKNNKKLPFGCHKPNIFGKNFEPYRVAIN